MGSCGLLSVAFCPCGLLSWSRLEYCDLFSGHGVYTLRFVANKIIKVIITISGKCTIVTNKCIEISKEIKEKLKNTDH